jgi:MFS family permease
VTSAGVAGPGPRTLARRLLPFQIAIGLQGMILWVPVEKLFMTQIGFNAASVGVLAAAYAAVVPLLEVPSGILADRRSRRLVMVTASAALMASSLLGGLSTNVTMYVLAAMILGVYFAMNSGTVDSIVYDLVLEETGSNALYETWIGRVRMVESGAFVASALGGGALAGVTSARLTYFASIPFMVLAVVAFLRFDEPRLHRSANPVRLRTHIAITVRTMIRQRMVLQVMLLTAMVALVSQAIFEFGPLWLIALSAPAVLFGPYWAALTATLGLGGYLAGKLRLDRRATPVLLACAGPCVAVTLAVSRSLAAVVIAQAVLALILAIVGIHAGRLLHDSVSSTVRTAVSSGAGTLSWVLFLPFSLVFGRLAREHGVQRSGWLLTAAALLAGVLLAVSVFQRAPRTTLAADEAAAAGDESAVAAADEGAPPTDLACKELVDLVTDHLDGVLPSDWRAGVENHLADCTGCTEHLRQIRLTIQALSSLTATGSPQQACDRTAR